MNHLLLSAPRKKVIIILAGFLLFSCNTNIVKNSKRNKRATNHIKTNSKLVLDSITAKKFITDFNKDYYKLDKKTLNKRYLSDTIHGDCIFHKLDLESLYNEGHLYLLKNNILNKEVFSKDFVHTLETKKQFYLNDDVLLISVKQVNSNTESSTLFRFKIVDNLIKLFAINCAG